MSADLIEERQPVKRIHVPELRTGRRIIFASPAPRRRPVPLATNDDEAKFIARSLLWMMLLAFAPLVLFYVLTYFFPDLFLIQVIPD